MLKKTFYIVSFCFIVSACAENHGYNQTAATEQEINQPVSTVFSNSSNKPNVDLKGTNEPKSELDNTVMNSSIEAQAIKEIKTQKQSDESQARRIEEYVKELDNELKPYKSYRSKLNALERATLHIDNADRVNKLSIEESFERRIAIIAKTCAIEHEALGGKVDKNEIKKSCYDFDDLNKPRNAWGFQ